MKNAITDWTWDAYKTFATVTTRFQMEVYESAATFLKGRVCELGSAAGKLTPYVNGRVIHFVGVDSSVTMHQAAEQVVKELPSTQTTFEFVCKSIEDFNPETPFDSGVSINSFYGWTNPALSLRRIAQCLQPDAPFVLATPNDRLSMPTLLQVAQKELVAHPHFKEFSRFNMALASNEAGYFPCLDELVGLARKQFRVNLAHQNFFMGGLNFLLLARR